MARVGHAEAAERVTVTPCGGHTKAMVLRALPCKAPLVNGSEGLLIVLGVVAGGSLVVYAIVKLTDRW
jgi:hypothetical protein